MTDNIKWPFSFSWKVDEKLDFSSEMQRLQLHLDTLSQVSWFRDRVSMTIWLESSRNIDSREINASIARIYENYLDNFSLIFPEWKKWDSVLFNIPSEHAASFLPFLVEKKYDENNPLFDYNVEYVIMDSPWLEHFWEDIEGLKYSYEYLTKKAEEADKYVEIMDYQWEPKDFVKDDSYKKQFAEINKKYRSDMMVLKKSKPYAKTYLPSLQQAELAWISYKELCAVFEKSWSLDWMRIEEANEQLAELIRDFDTVSIKWDTVDITFDIKTKGAINSVIATNYPWSEVYTVPNIDWVSGWIEYNNDVRIKLLWETICWIRLGFDKWRLTKFVITDKKYSEDENKELTKKLEKLFYAKEANRRLWELAFWTNFHVEPGFIHSLIWEKALWMHIALWNSYYNPENDWGKNQKVDNWNHEADYHIDLIRKMDDWSVVTFSKDEGESITIMNNWIYDDNNLPLLNNYQNEINEKKS